MRSTSEPKILVTKSGTVSVVNLALADPAALVASPIAGTLVRWRIGARSRGGPFYLRVIRPTEFGEYVSVGTSAGAYALGVPQTIATNIPIETGDLIALDVSPESGIGFSIQPGSVGGLLSWRIPNTQWPHPDPSTSYVAFEEDEWQFGFNADVQPPPNLGAISPASGPVSGSSLVKLTGINLEGATAVSFGTTKAQAFGVESDNQINVLAPPSASMGSVPVSVTTPAGTATAPAGFSYEGCLVPVLTHRKLAAAKRMVRAAGCRVGGVGKRRRTKIKTAWVIRQSPQGGSVVSSGAPVNVTLGAHSPRARR
jgi:hypothetical protein